MQIPGNLSKLKQRDHCKPLYHNCKQSCFTLVSFSKSSDLSSFVENKHKKKYRIAGFMYNLRTHLQPVSLKKLETDFFDTGFFTNVQSLGDAVPLSLSSCVEPFSLK